MIPIHYIEVKTEPPVDRTAFWRDMEACWRLHSPTAALRFAYSLIRARADVELLDEQRDGRMATVEWHFRHTALVRELWQQADQMGFLRGPVVRHIQIRSVSGG